jgi:hypothetical protein
MIHAMMSCTVLKFSTVATDGLKEIEEEDRSKCRRIANTQYNDLWYGANHLEAAYFLLFRYFVSSHLSLHRLRIHFWP